MKTKILPLLAIVALLGVGEVAFIGCKSPQAAAFKTISAIVTGSTTTVNAYYSLVIAGTIQTNGVPSVSAAFNHLQADAAIAIVEASGNSNAPAPVALIAESALFGLTVANASTIKK